MPDAKRPAAAHYPQVGVRSRAELRAWLDAHHGGSAGVWVVTFKKHVIDVHVSAVDVCEEALCFGWIDSLPRAQDADRSMLLIAPRQPQSAWSRVNKDRVERLLAAGAMSAAGLAVVAAAQASGTGSALDAVEALERPTLSGSPSSHCCRGGWGSGAVQHVVFDVRWRLLGGLFGAPSAHGRFIGRRRGPGQRCT